MQNAIAALKDKSNPNRVDAVVNLQKFGQPAVEFLVMALRDDDRWVRYLAADALANMGATRAVDNLIALLRDPDQDVRFAAASALGRLGDTKAISDLEEVMKKDNGYVKIAAEEALEKLTPIATRSAKSGSPVH